jgi:hypothetical protein
MEAVGVVASATIEVPTPPTTARAPNGKGEPLPRLVLRLRHARAHSEALADLEGGPGGPRPTLRIGLRNPCLINFSTQAAQACFL